MRQVRWVRVALKSCLLVTVLAASPGCRAHGPVVSTEPSQTVHVRFDPPRPFAGAAEDVREVRGVALLVTTDSIVLEPREIDLVGGATVRMSGAQSGIAIRRDASATMTAPRFSAQRTAGLALFLAAGATLVTVLALAAGHTSDGY